MKATMEPPAIPGVSPRLYVGLSEVAGVCGIDAYRLDTQYRPSDWAMPRDFRSSPRGELLCALESLPQLADALQAAGASDAALKLRKWTVVQIEKALAEAHAHGARGFPPPAMPRGWHAQWEARHNA